MQVELPLGATEDRICGTIDIEKALQEGIKAYEPGLLVRERTKGKQKTRKERLLVMQNLYRQAVIVQRSLQKPTLHELVHSGHRCHHSVKICKHSMQDS